MIVTVADIDPQETPPFKVSRRGHADLSGAPVQVNIPGEVAMEERTQGGLANESTTAVS